MKGMEIFLVFFAFFTLTTLVVPAPLFPGNMIQSLFSSLSIPASFYSPLLDALTNGASYGFVIWMAFVLVGRKLEESEAMIDASTSVSSTQVGNTPCPVHLGYLRRLQPGSSIPEECYICPRNEHCLNS
jgi:hypothetical protein